MHQIRIKRENCRKFRWNYFENGEKEVQLLFRVQVDRLNRILGFREMLFYFLFDVTKFCRTRENIKVDDDTDEAKVKYPIIYLHDRQNLISFGSY
jgi:hypothetical protein